MKQSRPFFQVDRDITTIMTKKKLVETAAKIIKNAYANNGRIIDKEVKTFYKIPQMVRLEAQRYVNLGLI